MLNPDGCIIGNHRTNMAKFDLNRQWEGPSPTLSPSIYHLKGEFPWNCNRKLKIIRKNNLTDFFFNLGLIASLIDQGRAPFAYVDLHGHSIKKNAFLFGCESSSDVLALPRLMNSLPMFSMMNCRFKLTRERCARTVVYRRLGVLRSYTLESTYNGCDQAWFKKFSVSRFFF